MPARSTRRAVTRPAATRLAAVFAVAALVLVGCGEGDPNSGPDSGPDSGADGAAETSTPADATNPLDGQPPQKVIGLALAETKSATSARLQVDAVKSGWVVDLRMSVDGKCAGTIEDGPKHQEIRSDGTDHFVKGNLAYWSSVMEAGKARAMRDVLGDKWAKLVKPANIAPTRELCSLPGWLGALNLSPSAFTSAGEPVTLEDGTEAVEFTSSEHQTVWVSADEPHRIVQFHQPGKESVTLTEQGEEVPVQPPPPTQVVELRK